MTCCGEIAHNPLAQPVLLVRASPDDRSAPCAAVFVVDHQMPARRRVALELFRDQDLRSATAPLEQIGHKLPGRVPVEPALHQHIEHRALMVFRVPQLALLAVDRDDYLIDSPLVASRQGIGPDTSSDIQPELQRAAAHRLVRQIDAAGYKQFLDRASQLLSPRSSRTIRFRVPTFFSSLNHEIR